MSVNREKETQPPFLIKTQQTRNRRELPHPSKGHCRNAITSITHSWGEAESLSAKIKTKTGVSTSPLLFSLILGGSSLCSQTKRDKRHWKEGIKWSLFVGDMIRYIEKLKESRKKKTQNWYVSLSGSQVTTSVYKEQLYFCVIAIKNPKLKFRIPFGIAPKNKHLGMWQKKWKPCILKTKILLRDERPK